MIRCDYYQGVVLILDPIRSYLKRFSKFQCLEYVVLDDITMPCPVDFTALDHQKKTIRIVIQHIMELPVVGAYWTSKETK